MITSLDFVALPSQDPERARRFYAETLGLRPDAKTDMAFFRDPDGDDLMLHSRYASQ
jgi:catechol 2,3-dioxygenase-like lactoylglutathione lyase family enzyme